MLLRAGNGNDGDSDGDKSVAIKAGEGTKKAFIKMQDVSLLYNQKSGNITTSIL